MRVFSNNKNNNIILYITIVVVITFSTRINNNLILTTIPLISKYYLNFNSVEIGILGALAVGSAGIMSALINSKLCSENRRKLFIASIIIYLIFLPLF